MTSLNFVTHNVIDFLDWLIAIEEVFHMDGITHYQCVGLAATKLKGGALAWWRILSAAEHK